jgi:hypothetical protein
LTPFACGLGGCDEDVPGHRGEPGVVDLEVRLSGVDDEQLRIGVAVQPRACAGTIVHQEQRNRNAAVLCANEPARL